MKSINRAVAAMQSVLIFPAALFMAALYERNFQPLKNEPVEIAQRIVMWYSDRLWTLWILLMAFPLAVLVAGGVTLLHSWSDDVEPALGAQPATVSVAAMTLISAVILAIVGLHTLAN